MAVKTETVCDSCGKAKNIHGEVTKVGLDIGDDLTLQVDAHVTLRCLHRALKTALEKHFATNGAAPS